MDQQPHDQFEKMVQQGAVLNDLNKSLQSAQKKEDEASIIFEDTKFRIAQSVYTVGQAAQINIADTYGYLQASLGWWVAAHETYDAQRMVDGGEPSGDTEHTALLNDAMEKRPTGELLNFLRGQIINYKKRILLGKKYKQNMDLQAIQSQLFGITYEQNTPVGRAAENAMHDSVNESAWMPFLVTGLEKCYQLLKSETPEQSVYSREVLEIIESDRQLLSDFVDGKHGGVALSSDMIDV